MSVAPDVRLLALANAQGPDDAVRGNRTAGYTGRRDVLKRCLHCASDLSSTDRFTSTQEPVMLRIERTPDGEGRVFRLVGELDGGTTRQFERVVAGPVGDGGDVTLDLGDLTACDGAGVDSLAVLARRARVAGGRLLFCSARDEIRIVLEDGNLEVGTSS